MFIGGLHLGKNAYFIFLQAQYIAPIKSIIKVMTREIRRMTSEDFPTRQKENQAKWSEIGLHKKAK